MARDGKERAMPEAKARKASETPAARAVPAKPRRRWLGFAIPLLVGLPIGTAVAAMAWREAPKPAAAIERVAVKAEPSSPVRTGPMSHKVMLAIVRSTLGAVANANDTGNYSVLRDLGAPGFRAANTPERLAETFASQRRGNLDLAGLMVTEPVVTIEPRIEATGMMRVAGYFPAGKGQFDFDLLYQPIEGRWRLFGISTGIAPAVGRLASADQAR